MLKKVLKSSSPSFFTQDEKSYSYYWEIIDIETGKLTKEVRNVAPFLIPFLKMVCVYFVLDLPAHTPSLTAAFVKALPILSLIWLVCLQGVGLGGGVFPTQFVTYNRRILCGLLLSFVGDVTLTWQQEEMYFMGGMLSFAVAHICYIIAFGLSPFGLKELVPCFVAILAIMYAIIPCVPGIFLCCAVFVYCAIIGIMGWRSLARFNLCGDIPWRKIFSATGAFLFVVSDTTLGIDKFCFSVPFAHKIIMSSYYGAQLCLALSVNNLHQTVHFHHPHGDFSTSPSSLSQSVMCTSI